MAGKGRPEKVDAVKENSAGQESPATFAEPEVKKEPAIIEKLRWIVLRPFGSARMNAMGERVQTAGEVGGDNGGVILTDGKKARRIADGLNWEFQIYYGKGKIIKPQPKLAFADVNWESMKTGVLQEKILELRESGAIEDEDISLSAPREEMIKALRRKCSKIIKLKIS